MDPVDWDNIWLEDGAICASTNKAYDFQPEMEVVLPKGVQIGLTSRHNVVITFFLEEEQLHFMLEARSIHAVINMFRRLEEQLDAGQSG